MRPEPRRHSWWKGTFIGYQDQFDVYVRPSYYEGRPPEIRLVGPTGHVYDDYDYRIRRDRWDKAKALIPPHLLEAP